MPSRDELVAHGRTEKKIAGAARLRLADLPGPRGPGGGRVRTEAQADASSTPPASTASTSPASSPAISSACSSALGRGQAQAARASVIPSRCASTVRYAARWHCLEAATPDEKVARTVRRSRSNSRRGELAIRATTHAAAPEPIRMPGPAPTPRLVLRASCRSAASAAPKGARPSSTRSRISNSTPSTWRWDAAYRFRGMPHAFYADWIGVAEDEARHFKLLRGATARAGLRLRRLRRAQRAVGDGREDRALGLARMALVPRVLEARGLDVTPGMIVQAARAGRRCDRGRSWS